MKLHHAAILLGFATTLVAPSQSPKTLHYAADQVEDTYIGHDVIGGRENCNQGKSREVRVGFQSNGQTFSYGLVGVKDLIGPGQVPPGARIVKAVLSGSFYVGDYRAAKGKIFIGRGLTDWLSAPSPGDAGPEGTGGLVEPEKNENTNYGPTFDCAFQYGGAWAGKMKDVEWKIPPGKPTDKQGFGVDDFAKDLGAPIQAESWDSADKVRFTADVTAIVQAMVEAGRSCGFVLWAEDHAYAAFAAREFTPRGGFELDVTWLPPKSK